MTKEEAEKEGGWVDPPFSCKAVWENGGLCSGGGYLVSKAALDRIRHANQTLEEFRDEYKSFGSHATVSDLTTTCLMYDRKVIHGDWGHVQLASDMNQDSPVGEVSGPEAAALTAHAARKKHGYAWHIWNRAKDNENVPNLIHAFHKQQKDLPPAGFFPR